MEQARTPNRRVLIVDDQAEIHDDFDEILSPDLMAMASDAFSPRSAGADVPAFELSHAMNGADACAIAKAGRDAGRPFALAYIDIRMPPEIDGIETIRRIREFEPDVEIVIMTAYTDKPLSEIVHDMPFPHKLLYIRKPFASEEVQQITLSLVGKWNIEEELAQNRRQMEVSNQRLQAVLNSTGDAIVMFDAGGRLQVANSGYEKLIGASEAELRLMPPGDVMARLQTRLRPPALPELGSRLLANGTGELREEIADADTATPRLFHLSRAPVRDGQENLMGHMAVYRDVSKEVEVEQMRAEVLRLRAAIDTTYTFDGIVGKSHVMQGLYALMQRAAESDITVLIQGESGTGKELVARMIHFNGPRRNRPFVAINCTAIPETLIESELFGHERGAFTGAEGRRTGQLETARGGTVLLDEIGDMPLPLQAKLLRFLQEREIQRVGGSGTIPIDVRVIAATNRNLDAAVKSGEFRADLYYRLAAFPLALPPLREHPEDIPLLVAHFLKEHATGEDESIRSISPTALQSLLAYHWPGNVRELKNAIERALLLETTDRLQVGSLPPELAPSTTSRRGLPESTAIMPLAEVERQAIHRALEVSNHNVPAAAQALGINRATLYRKLKNHPTPARA